jgi:hypothetical protein
MSYQLITIKKPGYLHFRVTGRNSLESVRGYLSAIYSSCVENLCPAVLIEENLDGTSLDIGQIFQVASTGSAATFPVIRVIAYVDTNAEHVSSRMQFAENVAVTRGINIRIFATVEAAESWLRDHIGELPG